MTAHPLEAILTDVHDLTADEAAALASTVDPADIEPGSEAGIAERLAASAPCTHTTASAVHLARCCPEVNCDRCGQVMPGVDPGSLLPDEAPICFDCAPGIEP